MIDDVLILKAIADKTRFKILKLLIKGEKCVCEIIPLLDVKQSTTSIHLRKLEVAEIIKSRRDGKKIYYKINNQKVVKILKALDYKKKE